MEENSGYSESRIQETHDYQLDPAFIEDRLIGFEERSRRKNLRVDGIKERWNGTWENCDNELHALCQESLGIEEEVVIGRARKVKTDKNKKSNTPRTIVYRILNYKDKAKILRKCQKTER